MEVLTIESSAFQDLVKKLEAMHFHITSLGMIPYSKRLDNQEFMELLKISKRTAQHYRDSGLISFSQVGAKIYYRLDDIEELMNKNYIKAFKK